MWQTELFSPGPERNTKIDDILFRVGAEPVYVGTDKRPVSGFKAIVGYPYGDDLTRRVYSIVSDQYQLVHNRDALTYAEDVYRQLFEKINTSQFEVFNILYPKPKSYCHVDIIDKNYTVNVWQQEVYVPYIRMTNSYNKTKTLRFSLGFCRKLCNNGLIFEKETIEVSVTHTKSAVNHFRLKQPVGGLARLKKLEETFIQWLLKLKDYPVQDKYVLPLCAKILDQSFDIKTKNWERLERESKRLNQFNQTIEALKNKYVSELGPNAYAVHNIATDYATNRVRPDQVNSLQRRAGNWLDTFCSETTIPGFSLEAYVKDYQYLVK